MSDNDLIRRGFVASAIQEHVNDDYDRAQISRAIAALPAEPVMVTVKPLVWEEPSHANNWVHVARSIFGEYYVSIDGGRHSAWLEASVKPYENKIGDDVGSVYEAKELAEADYQKRFHKADLVAAIDVQPDPRDAQIAALVEAAEAANVMMGNLIDVMGTPDVQMCCNGYMCGCQGATVYDEAEHYARQSIAQLSAAIAPAKGGV